MAQEKIRQKPRERPGKAPSAETIKDPEPGLYRYGKEAAKPPVFLIGLLLVFILIIGGTLVLFILQKPGPIGPGPILPNQTNHTINQTNMTNVTICDDQCLYTRALTGQNISDCRLISGATLQQDCYYQLSQLSFEACKVLANASRKRICITSFAVAGKDISLCDLLADGRDGCRLAVDPCVTATDRMLCLAMVDNNPSLCGGNSTCLLNYSFTKRDSVACGLISEAAVSKACISAIKLTDKCSDLEALAERDYCYQYYAIYSNDYLVCTQISSGSNYAVDCYSYFAARRADLQICDIFSLNDRWDCYTHYALWSGDLDGCREVDTLATTHRFNCVFEYAKLYGNPAACDVIEALPSRSTCYQGVIIYSNRNLNWTFCDAVTSFDWRNKCYSESAKLYGNVSLCDYAAQDSFSNEACRIAYAANQSG